MTKDRVASRIRSLFREISFVDEELKAANHSIAANLELVELRKYPGLDGHGHSSRCRTGHNVL